jgi:hypothetical protein
MAGIFLNYSARDREAAGQLLAWLKAQNYPVWSDRDLPLGTDFAAEIRAQIEQAQALLTIWSQHAVISSWVRAEAQFALDRGVRLIPIRIDNSPLPVPFNVYQAPLITDWNRDLEQIRGILDQSTGQKSQPSPSPNSNEADAWKLAKDDHDPAQLKAFLSAFPHSGYSEAARERLASIAWERLRSSDDIIALNQFATDFKETAAADHASKRLILLQHTPTAVPSHSESATGPRIQVGWGARIIRFLQSSFAGSSPMPDVFISYRREDSSDITGRMFDRLVQVYARNRIFKDVDSIPLGVDFREYVGGILEACSMCLVVMGKDWLGHKPGLNIRRIDEPKDFVRIEIEAALKNGIPVIPVFVHGSSMPPEEVLPRTITALAFRNGMELRADPYFHKDMDRLIGGMELYRDRTQQRPRSLSTGKASAA